MNSPFSLPYELRLGVTGHRSIGDEPAVARAISRLLGRLSDTLAHQDVAPLSWTIVSPLARGADRLAARAILDEKGGRLEVVTPFPLHEYRKDFSGGADIEEFEQLLARASHVHEIGSLPVGPAVVAGEPLDRDAAYLRAGEEMVDACEMVLAIWNGRPAAGPGGSADIVAYALHQQRVVLWIHAERPDEPARVLRSPLSLISSDGVPAEDQAADLPSTMEELSRGYCEQARYCRDTSVPPGTHTQQVSAMRQQLLHAATEVGLHASSLDATMAVIVPPFVRADLLALHYQRRYTWAINGVLYLAAGGVTSAVAQVLFFPEHVWVILLEIIAMLAVFVLWWYGRHQAWHQKWLQARYLAERLRTALFTAAWFGAPAPADRDDPLPFYGGPQHWLILAVDGLSRSAAPAGPSPPFDALKAFIVRRWLEDQQRFHARKAGTTASQAHSGHLLGFALFGVTLLMALLHFLGVGHQDAAHGARLLHVDLWITFLALVLPVWAGAVHAVTSQTELARIAERSKRMARVLEQLTRRASRARTADELRQATGEAATVISMENHEWWVLLSFQDVRLHV